MRTKGIFAATLLVAGITGVKGQDWNRTPGGDVIGTNEYLGAATGSTVALRIKTVPNLPIDFYTSDNYKLRLYPNVVGNIPNAQGGTDAVNQDGFVVISPEPAFYGAGNYGPFTRLHLADLNDGSPNAYFYNQPWGFRTWMRNGITFTGNHDHGYIGQRYYDHDETDMVLHWSDNHRLRQPRPECTEA